MHAAIGPNQIDVSTQMMCQTVEQWLAAAAQFRQGCTLVLFVLPTLEEVCQRGLFD
jgi:hypothetical protein